jgi:hypothetical protein
VALRHRSAVVLLPVKAFKLSKLLTRIWKKVIGTYFRNPKDSYSVLTDSSCTPTQSVSMIFASTLSTHHFLYHRTAPARKCHFSPVPRSFRTDSVALDLSSVSFHHMGICALNVERLRSLELCNCPGTFDWLQLIVDSEKAMNLKLFELTFKLSYTSFWRRPSAVSQMEYRVTVTALDALLRII